MPDRGNDRLFAHRHRANDAFLVERPQILHRAAAPRHDDDADVFQPFEHPNPRRDFLIRADALHAHRAEQDARVRVAPQRYIQNVVNHRARRRGNHADGIRVARQSALSFRRKQPLAPQLLLEHLQPLVEHTHALRMQPLHDELILPAPRVQRHASARRRAHAFKRHGLQIFRLIGVHHAGNRGVFVFHREKQRAGLVKFQIADFALQLNGAQHRIYLKHSAHIFVELRDRQFELSSHGVPPRRACWKAASRSSSGRRRRAPA